MPTPTIAAVVVNHNTSLFTELALRSLFAQHTALRPVKIVVYDNDSTDDTSALRAFAATPGFAWVPSGFPLGTRNNSHGEILRRFVLEHPDCSHYLFLDTDVVFVQPETIQIMLAELDADPTAFGIGARQSWDGLVPVPAEILRANPNIQDARLHPCCALVANTALFRTIVEAIGLSAANYLWAERDEYLDTFALLTRVMRTHGLYHRISRALVRHFFTVSYDYDDPATRAYKLNERDRLLAALRA